MQVIHIENETPIQTLGHSSKGNQLKWKIGNNWIKADGFGYESLSEIVVSKMLGQTDIEEYVEYVPVKVWWQDREYDGCMSENFREEGWELVTVERLYRLMTGLSLAAQLAKFGEVQDRIAYMVDFVRNLTGLTGFGQYLATMLELDAVFLNEDRHTNNIAFLYHSKKAEYRYCPYFDFGAGLYSDILGDYPLEKSVEKCESLISAKPFSADFDLQAEEARKLYPGGFHFSCSKNDLLKLWEGIKKEYESCSVRKEAHLITERVDEVLHRQFRKYAYLF